jgi:hypothetical protein
VWPWAVEHHFARVSTKHARGGRHNSSDERSKHQHLSSVAAHVAGFNPTSTFIGRATATGMVLLPLLAALALAVPPTSSMPASTDTAASPSPSPSPSSLIAPPPSPAVERPLLLVLDVDAAHLPPVDRDGLGEALTLALTRRLDLDVQSMRALAARAQLGAEQQAAGCDTSSCLAEIANAMGARYVAYTRVARLGDNQLMRLDIFDSNTGRTVALASQQGSLSMLFDGTDRLVETLLTEAAGALPARSAVAASSSGAVDVPGIIVTASGVAGVAVGVVLGVVAFNNVTALTTASEAWVERPTAQNAHAVIDARAIADTSLPMLVVGGVVGVAGIAAAVVGATMLADGDAP